MNPLRQRPAFLITVDTEGDHLWSKPREITTRNSRYLPRFQALCEKYGLKPTYLTNWEMANCPVFRDFGQDVIAHNTGEIGMHLHAWNSPPINPLTDNDYSYQPYLIEYPQCQIREKVKMLTECLRETFQVDVVSHRAGRWSLDETYVRSLIEHGYLVDCSVTPHVSWTSCLGRPSGGGGTDFTTFPETPYRVDPRDIKRPDASSTLLELPMTIVRFRYPFLIELGRRLLRRNPRAAAVMRRVFPDIGWLRADGGPASRLLSVLDVVRRENRAYAEFMIHSSELMPGGSPTFPDEASIEALYESLDVLFQAAAASFTGRTLGEFHDLHVGSESVAQ